MHVNISTASRVTLYSFKHIQMHTVFQRKGPTANHHDATFTIHAQELVQEALLPQRQRASEVITPFKVTDFSTNGKPVCDFLFVNNSNLILSRTVFQLPLSSSQIITLHKGCLSLIRILGNLCKYIHTQPGVPLFNTLIPGEPLNSQQQNLTSRN